MSEESEMKWPSKRIPQGGLFHPPKVKYSQETSDLIKLLMEEAKMSMLVRKKINYHLRNGEPLPVPQPKHPRHHEDDLFNPMDLMNRLRVIRKKPLESIVASGAYDKPRYRPKPDIREPVEKAKLRLQEKMSGMKISTSVLEPKRKAKEMPEISLDPEDRIDELLEEINERAEWLAEMEELGEGKKYRAIIHNEIAERLSDIKTLQKKIANRKLNFQSSSSRENSS